MLTTKEEVEAWLIEFDVFNYTIHDDLSVSVEGDVRYSPSFVYPELPYLPVNFREVSGTFFWSHTILETLQGCPYYVGEDFDCSYNKLQSLEGGPMYVGGKMNCSYNQLTDLVGAPQNKMYAFSCQNNLLQSLKGAPPEVEVSFNCGNNQLTTLVGGPLAVGKDLDCTVNWLTNFEGLPTITDNLLATDNRLVSLQGLPTQLDGVLFVGFNQLTSLEGAPEYVGGNFDCRNNPLHDLAHFSTRVNSQELFNCPKDIIPPEARCYYDEEEQGIFGYDIDKLHSILEQLELDEKVAKPSILEIQVAQAQLSESESLVKMIRKI